MTHEERMDQVRQIANALGSDYAAELPKDETWNERTITGPNNERFSVGPIWNKPDMLQIRGEYPNDGRGHTYAPRPHTVATIRVRVDRSPAIIAKEIKRRFLPQYQPVLEKAMERKFSHEDYDRDRLSLGQELAAILGVQCNEDGHSVFGIGEGSYADVEAGGEGTACLNLRSIPADKARAILRLFVS